MEHYSELLNERLSSLGCRGGVIPCDDLVEITALVDVMYERREAVELLESGDAIEAVVIIIASEHNRENQKSRYAIEFKERLLKFLQDEFNIGIARLKELGLKFQ